MSKFPVKNKRHDRTLKYVVTHSNARQFPHNGITSCVMMRTSLRRICYHEGTVVFHSPSCYCPLRRNIVFTVAFKL